MGEVIKAFEKVLTFDFGEREFRTSITSNGEPLFCGKDVCELLDISKYRDATARLDEDQRCPVLVDTVGGSQTMTFITEGGLYELILRSRKPEAKVFRKWITDEVLPQIRRTGSYTQTPQTTARSRSQYIELVKLISKSKTEFERQQLKPALEQVSRELGYKNPDYDLLKAE
ncbi:BRO family protein [Vibrio sp. La 4.2.2]|uniref:BRO-N domain-containing protein n=1 Tax=Vibrio sp. La 4.2.2 TaxID=2998830 RepID=UPI0022CDC9DE|nr:BRO family protein [Vibrio sp. La 4.2.2]MDA0109034.1 BRO family protein [Vibrio sp. La 4.2.2]